MAGRPLCGPTVASCNMKVVGSTKCKKCKIVDFKKEQCKNVYCKFVRTTSIPCKCK